MDAAKSRRLPLFSEFLLRLACGAAATWDAFEALDVNALFAAAVLLDGSDVIVGAVGNYFEIRFSIEDTDQADLVLRHITRLA